MGAGGAEHIHPGCFQSPEHQKIKYSVLSRQFTIFVLMIAGKTATGFLLIVRQNGLEISQECELRR